MNFIKSFIISIILVGCLTTHKSEKRIDKIYDKHPEVLAKKTNQYFPVKEFKTIDSSNIISFRKKVNDIKKEIYLDKDTIYKNRIINNDCNQIQQLNEKYKIRIDQLIKLLDEQPPVIKEQIRIKDSADLFILQRNIDTYKSDAIKYKKRYHTTFNVSLILILIILLYVLFKYLRLI